jgi:NAD(P)-dependent dehydrogenase (short-subunit alcohol dehydrogenase family)
MDINLKNRTILVTGAAQGLGLGIARRLAGSGARVVLVDCNPVVTECLADPLLANSGIALVRDLAEPDAARDLMRSASEKMGMLDGLVNCAAWSFHKPFSQTTISEFDRVVAINQRAPFFLSQEFAKAVSDGIADPCIVNIASVNALVSLWNAMDVLEARTALRVLGRWYTNPGGVEVRPSDVVIRDGTVVPQDRDFSHYKEPNRYGEIVRDMIAVNWGIIKKCRDDAQTVAGIVKDAQLRVFGPVLSWLVTQGAAKRDLGPIEAWPINAINAMPDQIILTRLLTAARGRKDAWERTCIAFRPFHATTNFAKRYSRVENPILQIEKRRKDETAAEGAGAFVEDADFWREFRGAADPYVQMLNHTWYANCFMATIPRLESERYLPRLEFIVPEPTYSENTDPTHTSRAHMERICSALRQTGFEVSSEHSMFRDSSTLEVLPEIVARAHDTVKMWAKELLNRVDEYLAAIIGRHIQTKRTRGIRVRPFTKDEFKILHQTLEEERRRIGGGSSSNPALDG